MGHSECRRGVWLSFHLYFPYAFGWWVLLVDRELFDRAVVARSGWLDIWLKGCVLYKAVRFFRHNWSMRNVNILPNHILVRVEVVG